MSRSRFLIAAAAVIAFAAYSQELWAQTGVPRVANRPFVNAPPPQADPIPANSFEAGKAVAAPNKIVQPMPLAANEKDAALGGIDKHIAEEVARLKTKVSGLLPDEIGVLAKTAGWTADAQQKMLAALRANDPPAVYSAWTAAAPQDIAGAELAARQTDVRRILMRMEQDADKKPSALHQDVTDLDAALAKIGTAVPGIHDLMPAVGTLKNWIEARGLVEAAVPGKGTTAQLPKGKINLIYDPSLNPNVAIVLNNESMLIGNEGRGPLMLTKGNAAEALGMPIVTGDPVPDASHEDMTTGILLINHNKTRGTINYTLDGTKYIMEPGMVQRLPGDNKDIVAFDRGAPFGPAVYTVTPGTYAFTPTDEGWQLFKEHYDVVLDNSQSTQEFNFVYNGEKQTIPAGATRTISADYPVVIGYDRGNGTDYCTKVCYFSGNVQIGVNAVDNLWDLFPTTDNQRETTKLKLFQ